MENRNNCFVLRNTSTHRYSVIQFIDVRIISHICKPSMPLNMPPHNIFIAPNRYSCPIRDRWAKRRPTRARFSSEISARSRARAQSSPPSLITTYYIIEWQTELPAGPETRIGQLSFNQIPASGARAWESNLARVDEAISSSRSMPEEEMHSDLHIRNIGQFPVSSADVSVRNIYLGMDASIISSINIIASMNDFPFVTESWSTICQTCNLSWLLFCVSIWILISCW